MGLGKLWTYSIGSVTWIGSPIRFPQNLSFVFVVSFIRAHLRGASLGTRTELGHGLIIVLEMAWVMQQRQNLFNEFSNQQSVSRTKRCQVIRHQLYTTENIYKDSVKMCILEREMSKFLHSNCRKSVLRQLAPPAELGRKRPTSGTATAILLAATSALVASGS